LSLEQDHNYVKGRKRLFCCLLYRLSFEAREAAREKCAKARELSSTVLRLGKQHRRSVLSIDKASPEQS
jgi:hypothetical protein